jgi:PIN domain nuclease of toxin-antitoxin system
MNVLLDTHVFLWLALDSKKISSLALAAITNAPKRYVSLASVWEMQIKSDLNKLPITAALPTLIDETRAANSIITLPITQDHIYRLADLPPLHKDPFDRMLVAQAQHEDLTLVTVDENIAKYAVETAW